MKERRPRAAPRSSGDDAPAPAVAARSVASRRAQAQRASSGGRVRMIAFLVVIVALAGGGYFAFTMYKLDRALTSIAAFPGIAAPSAASGSAEFASALAFDQLPEPRKLELRQAAAIGEPIIDAFALRVQSGASPTETQGIAYVAGLRGNYEAQDLLVAITEKKSDELTSQVAAWNLGRIGGARGRMTIQSWAKSGDASAANLALIAAAAARESEASDSALALSALRESRDPQIQAALIAALMPVAIAREDTGRYLIELIVDGDETVSALALAEMTRRFGEYQAYDRKEELRRHLRDRGINHRERYVRINSRRFLRMIGGVEMVKVCQQDLIGDDAELAAEAARGLVQMNDSRSCDALKSGLERGHEIAARDIAFALSQLCKPIASAKESTLVMWLRERIAAPGVVGASALLTLALIHDEISLRETYEAYAASPPGLVQDLLHEALVEHVGQNLGKDKASWAEWWAKNEKIIELKREVRELVAGAKAIGETGERSRYGEAKKMVEAASEKLFQLEELEGRTYTSWHTEINSMLDGLHKHTILDLDEDEESTEEDEGGE